MSSLFNLGNIARVGGFRFAYNGKDLIGTVVRHNINKKTVTVLCSFPRYDKKMQRNWSINRTYQVHDQQQFCVAGDKVIITLMPNLSKTKHFYVKRVIRAQGRNQQEFLHKDMSQTRWLQTYLN